MRLARPHVGWSALQRPAAFLPQARGAALGPAGLLLPPSALSPPLRPRVFAWTLPTAPRVRHRLAPRPSPTLLAYGPFTEGLRPQQCRHLSQWTDRRAGVGVSSGRGPLRAAEQ